jgi:hypothetical protein
MRTLAPKSGFDRSRDGLIEAATRIRILTRSRNTDLRRLRADSLETIVGQKPLNLPQTIDNLKQNATLSWLAKPYRLANFTDDLGETVAHALASRRECQFDLDQVDPSNQVAHRVSGANWHSLNDFERFS